MEAGEQLVFTAGAVPLDPDGRLVGPGDRSAQAGKVLTNLAEALHAAALGYAGQLLEITAVAVVP